MHPIPKDFEDRIRREFGDEATPLLQSLESPVHTSLLLNKGKIAGPLPVDQQVPWCDIGFFLKERPSFTLDPTFHSGAYYPQESSSMFLHHVLKHLSLHTATPLALDVCASPGGKSILLSEYLEQKGGRLISNEINKTRNHILCENLSKWGARNVIVSSSDTSHFNKLTNYFDLVLVDAPCSGEGMFRKDETARKEWSLNATISCSVRQKDILQNIIPSIKSGGYLIYSTCTFAKEENEEIVDWLISTGDFKPVTIPVPEEWNVRSVSDGTIGAHQFLPHLVKGEGLFMAVLQKTSTESGNTKIFKKPEYKACSNAEVHALKSWIHLDDQSVVKNKFDQLFASPFTDDQLNVLSSAVYITQPGIALGKWLKSDFIPEHALALSSLVSDSVSRQELSHEEALHYLRGEAIASTGETGWMLVTYLGNALGWIKSLSNRTNNYYPKQWRIRMK